jgi:hypothetical protein
VGPWIPESRRNMPATNARTNAATRLLLGIFTKDTSPLLYGKHNI